MGYYSKRRIIRKFWDNPLVNLCYTLAILAIVAGVFGIFGCIGGANCLPFTIAALVTGFLLILLGKKLNARKKDRK